MSVRGTNTKAAAHLPWRLDEVQVTMPDHRVSRGSGEQRIRVSDHPSRSLQKRDRVSRKYTAALLPLAQWAPSQDVASSRLKAPWRFRTSVQATHCQSPETWQSFTRLDVDQGLSTPGFCSRGSCTNTAGSYVYLCPCGFASSLDSSRCLDQRAGTCFWVLVGGRCAKDLTGHDTGRQCCLPDARRLRERPLPREGVGVGLAGGADGRGCLDTHVRSACYGTEKGSCARPSPGAVTRSECCCASPDRGFGGPCQLCPARSSGEFWSLCSRGLGVPAETSTSVPWTLTAVPKACARTTGVATASSAAWAMRQPWPVEGTGVREPSAGRQVVVCELGRPVNVPSACVHVFFVAQRVHGHVCLGAPRAAELQWPPRLPAGPGWQDLQSPSPLHSV
ncbi:fibrillin-3 [Manis javanica]|uniref:fibrillin-3 n=1 Tax=Manis javanica TaxID=9974 RepID=UPI003C6D7D77